MTPAIFAMMRARSCAEFREALRPWVAPVQNVVYADTGGNIAYTYAGRVPIRAQGDGCVPSPGWTGDHEWLGYVPFEELPHLYNPPQGYVATANNRVTGDGYAHYLGRDFVVGSRAKRIVELIEAQQRADVATCEGMQLDLVSPYARLMAGHLGRLETAEPELAAVVRLMCDWDGEVRADSPAAAVHQVFARRLLHLTLSDRLGDLAVRYTGKGPTPVLTEGSAFGSRAMEWLETVLAQPDSHWFDLGNGEGRDEVMRLALRDTVDFLKAELGPEIGDWAWGKLHTLTYRHTLGQVKPLDRLLNRGPYPLDGDGTTLCATGSALYDLRRQEIVAAPYRFVVDLGDLRNSVGLLVPGQSGQPGSPHYDDQIEAWFRGENHPLLYHRQDVEREAEARLRLVPDDKT